MSAGRRKYHIPYGSDKVFIGDVIVDLGIKKCIHVCCTDKVRKSRGSRVGKTTDNSIVVKNTDSGRDYLV